MVINLVSFFQRQQEQNSNFFHAFDLDKSFHVENVFLVDTRWRDAYELVGDLTTFNNTYLTDQYEMAFVTFVGVNHHR